MIDRRRLITLSILAVATAGLAPARAQEAAGMDDETLAEGRAVTESPVDLDDSLLGQGLTSEEQAIIQGDDSTPPLPAELAAEEGADEWFSMRTDDEEVIGRDQPPPVLDRKAREIIDAAPFACRPVDVALYYRAVGQGETAIGRDGQRFDFGTEGRPYARAWPRYYNPIIIEFFNATGLRPLAPGFDGDATPWCAAFVNYCIERAASRDGRLERTGRGTNSASSGSFRCFGDQIGLAEAREGDLVVWAREGSVRSQSPCSIGQGHVGFFVRSTGHLTRRFVILGGNQTEPVIEHHSVAHRMNAIVSKSFPDRYSIGSGVNAFHSIQTRDFLRG